MRAPEQALLDYERAAALMPTSLAAAAGRALAQGIAWRINLVDPIGSVVDEAINQAERAGITAPPPAVVGVLPSTAGQFTDGAWTGELKSALFSGPLEAVAWSAEAKELTFRLGPAGEQHGLP